MAGFKIWLRENYLYLTILALLAFVAYGGTLNHTFVADDVPGILKNPQITQASYIFKNPLTLVKNILYFTIVNLFGRSPAAFRATNILLHLGNIWLIFFLITHLLDRRTAFFTAAIFAVHPIATEAVTWISGGQYARYSFFLLLALVLYVLSDENRERKFYWASMGSFIIALLNSEKAMTFPLILLLLELACQTIRKNWKRLIISSTISGIWALIFISKIGQRVADVQTSYYQPPQTIKPLLQIPVAISSYLKLLFWPRDLTLYHSEMSFSASEFYLMTLVLVIFLGLTVYTYRKNKAMFFFLSLFPVSLLPVLTPFGISWIVAERYVYLGSLGIFAFAAMTIEKLVTKTTRRYQLVGRSSNLYVILFFLLLPLMARTIVRNRDWRNQDTLWLAAAKTSPSSPQNHNNLGDLYGRRGDLEKSAEEFKKAIELNPNYADAYHNLGNTYQQMGRIEEAIESYKKAFELNPRLWQSCQNLAAIYFERGEFKLAKEWMEKAVAINPTNSNLRHNLEIINAQLSIPTAFNRVIIGS